VGLFDFLFPQNAVQRQTNYVVESSKSGLKPEEYADYKLKQSASKAALAGSAIIPAVGGIGAAALTGSALLNVGSTVIDQDVQRTESKMSSADETGDQGPNETESEVVYIVDQSQGQTPVDTMSSMFGPMMMMMMMMMMPQILGNFGDKSDTSSMGKDIYD
jgi:hypothetical protein